MDLLSSSRVVSVLDDRHVAASDERAPPAVVATRLPEPLLALLQRAAHERRAPPVCLHVSESAEKCSLEVGGRGQDGEGRVVAGVLRPVASRARAATAYRVRERCPSVRAVANVTAVATFIQPPLGSPGHASAGGERPEAAPPLPESSDAVRATAPPRAARPPSDAGSNGDGDEGLWQWRPAPCLRTLPVPAVSSAAGEGGRTRVPARRAVPPPERPVHWPARPSAAAAQASVESDSSEVDSSPTTNETEHDARQKQSRGAPRRAPVRRAATADDDSSEHPRKRGRRLRDLELPAPMSELVDSKLKSKVERVLQQCSHPVVEPSSDRARTELQASCWRVHSLYRLLYSVS